jgi:hypothetical protein
MKYLVGIDFYRHFIVFFFLDWAREREMENTNTSVLCVYILLIFRNVSIWPSMFDFLFEYMNIVRSCQNMYINYRNLQQQQKNEWKQSRTSFDFYRFHCIPLWKWIHFYVQYLRKLTLIRLAMYSWCTQLHRYDSSDWLIENIVYIGILDATST